MVAISSYLIKSVTSTQGQTAKGRH